MKQTQCSNRILLNHYPPHHIQHVTTWGGMLNGRSTSCSCNTSPIAPKSCCWRFCLQLSGGVVLSHWRKKSSQPKERVEFGKCKVWRIRASLLALHILISQWEQNPFIPPLLLPLASLHCPLPVPRALLCVINYDCAGWQHMATVLINYWR